MLSRLWSIYPLTAMTVQAMPDDCLRALALAARPSQERLHLRNLFTDGRRYYLDPRRGGFRLMCNSKISWRRRGRTTLAAVLQGEFSEAGEGATRILLRSRMRLLFLVDIFLIPVFMTSLLIYAPWPPLVIAGLAAVLFGLSWAWHRLMAMLQAAEMVYFVQKALEDIAPVEIPVLGGPSPDMITQDGEFREQWEKFYQRHKGESRDEG